MLNLVIGWRGACFRKSRIFCNAIYPLWEASQTLARLRGLFDGSMPEQPRTLMHSRGDAVLDHETSQTAWSSYQATGLDAADTMASTVVVVKKEGSSHSLPLPRAFVFLLSFGRADYSDGSKRAKVIFQVHRNGHLFFGSACSIARYCGGFERAGVFSTSSNFLAPGICSSSFSACGISQASAPGAVSLSSSPPGAGIGGDVGGSETEECETKNFSWTPQIHISKTKLVELRQWICLLLRPM